MAVAKQWLLCRGAKVTGKRTDLMTRFVYHSSVSIETSTFINRPTICLYRVNNYIENGLSKDKEDPDGGVNLAKKKKKLGAADEVDPELNEKFPCYGFQCGISELPRISFGHISKYLIEEVEIRKKLSTEKLIVKGYNFYKSGHVRQIFSKR